MKEPLKINYDRTGMPYQDAFHDSIKTYDLLSAGYGGGKTYSLCMKGFRLMNLNRGCAGGILCPSLRMYRKDVFPTLIQICNDNNIRYYYNKSEMVWHFPQTNSTVYVFHSEDDGLSIKGPNLGWGLINEVTLVSEMAFKVFLSRMRMKKAKLIQIAMSGTPEGFNWTYEYFIEKPRPDTDVVFGNARLNPHNHESYIRNLEASYDPLMQEQYIDGKYVNIRGGRAAYAFNRFKHTSDKIERIDGMPVYVSMDFNVDPMSATLYNVVNLDTLDTSHRWGAGKKIQGWDEVCIHNSDTDELCTALIDKIGRDRFGKPAGEVYVYPDPAGRNRSTKLRNTSDFDILRDRGFRDLRYRSQVSVRDCLNALNNALSKDWIMLNSKACPNTIADLEQCILKKDVFEVDKSNSKRTHWLDGMKNFIEYEFPTVRPVRSREEKIR